jgi:adenine-specific DNA-methyltransferase
LDYSGHDGRISQIEPLVGKSGWLKASLLTVEALGQSEDHLLLAGTTDDGAELSAEAAGRLMTIGGQLTGETALPETDTPPLDRSLAEQQDAIRRTISTRNAQFFEAEADKLDGWADDLKVGLEREIKELDRQIKEARRAATAALTLEEKLAGQKAVKAVEIERNTKRRSLFEAQDLIDEQRSELIESIEGRLEQAVTSEALFTIRWRVE